MRYKVDHDYHIHSQLSSCSNDPEQSTARILQYAKDDRLERICITDHFWDSAVAGASGWYAPQNFEHISRSLPLPQAEGIEFLFGCETELDRKMTVAASRGVMDELSFIIIPTTHLHMRGLTITEKDASSDSRRAELWVERLEAVLDKDLPFHKVGIAHLACGLLNNTCKGGREAVLQMIPDREMERVFSKAAERGCGIELNQYDMSFSDENADVILRPFRIAKECGCKFYLGSDAHHPDTFAHSKEIFERAVTMLDLSESDKFHIE